jgi:hypothetical protein
MIKLIIVTNTYWVMLNRPCIDSFPALVTPIILPITILYKRPASERDLLKFIQLYSDETRI